MVCGIAVMPSLAIRVASRSWPGFFVVSSLSPRKIELAPARKHSACSSSLICSRPADSRTIEAGITMRATAMVRTNSMPSSGAWPSSGVPSTCTSMLIGTLSGWAGRVARLCSSPVRSSAFSPKPTMPPQHTFSPAARTLPRVSSRSW